MSDKDTVHPVFYTQNGLFWLNRYVGYRLRQHCESKAIFKTLKLLEIQRPNVYFKQLELKKYRSTAHDASFDTFIESIGRLFTQKLSFKVLKELILGAFLLQN